MHHFFTCWIHNVFAPLSTKPIITGSTSFVNRIASSTSEKESAATDTHSQMPMWYLSRSFGMVINNGNKAPVIKGALATNPQKRDSLSS